MGQVSQSSAASVWKATESPFPDFDTLGGVVL